MKQLSSELTEFTKKSYLLLMIATVLITLSYTLGLPQYSQGTAALFENVSLLSFFLPILVAGVGYYIYSTINTMMDSAVDTGDSLLLIRDNTEIEIPLSQVQNIEYHVTHRPQSVTLTLKNQTPFGHQIKFMSAHNMLPLSKHK